MERRRRTKSASACRCLRMRLRASPASPAMIASAILACACSVSSPTARPMLLPVRRVEQGHPVEDVDEQLEPRVATDGRHQRVQLTGVAARPDRCAVGETPQRGQVTLVGPLGRQLAGELLQDDAGLEDLVQRGVDPVQVEHHGVTDGADRRLADHQAPARPAAGAGDLLVLHEAHRLSEDGPAHVVALEEVRLGAQHLAHRPPQGHHVLDDEVRHLGRTLGVRVGTRTRHVPGCRRRRHRPILPGRRLT